MMSIVITKLKHLILFFVNLFRRALCCFRRRRRSSFDAVPLTHVGVVASEPEESWNWEDRPENAEPRTVQDHIELYRKKKAHQAGDEQDAESQLDFFGDMAPRITQQTKVLIGGDERNDFGSRLDVADNVPMETGELREWEESAGWEGQTLDWDAQEALREKKRQDRERRLWEQQQKRQEKAGRSLGARVAT